MTDIHSGGHDELIERARVYATKAHQRIDQRRKYSGQPYHVHLETVAEIVASVTDDAETIAAAWLHDTVEDTPATLEDIEHEFGVAVAELVEELTDVSKPSDGNRAQRKSIDRQHSAQASSRAKTVKLADLIDNCRDITRNDPRFAQVYLAEMAELLTVLANGDATLYKRAQKVHGRCIEKLGLDHARPSDMEQWVPRASVSSGFAGPEFKRMFSEIFSARDIAEGLLSFDADSACDEVRSVLQHQRKQVASVRLNGSVQGYLRLADLESGDVSQLCTDIIRHFTVDQVVAGGASFSDVIHVLTRHDYCFVTALGNVSGVVCRDDMNKPVVRMWLFGIVTLIEISLMDLVQRRFPEDSWRDVISQGRLEKAKSIQAERQRRNVNCALIECLQFSDKGQILIEDPEAMKQLGFKSKSVAKKAIRELESLRNHLAHAQDIVEHDWAQIARLSIRMQEMTGLTDT
jgi:hypothetical protein